MICVATIHLAVYTNGDSACFTIIIVKFTYNIINIYGKENR